MITVILALLAVVLLAGPVGAQPELDYRARTIYFLLADRFNPHQPYSWKFIDASDPALPAGAEALLKHVQAPAELARRLNQIGVVEESAPNKDQVLSAVTKVASAVTSRV